MVALSTDILWLDLLPSPLLSFESSLPPSSLCNSHLHIHPRQTLFLIHKRLTAMSFPLDRRPPLQMLHQQTPLALRLDTLTLTCRRPQWLDGFTSPPSLPSPSSSLVA